LGSPFQGLAVKDPAIATRFADATRNAFAALVARAIEEHVKFVVIAGDVFDGEWKDNSIGLFFNREVARLDRAGIRTFVLRGNHDAESVVTKSIQLPASVAHFESRVAQTFRIEDLKVALHGRSFADRAATENFAVTYPAPESGWFNIGVLHTSLTGRPPHANYAPCSITDLCGRGYDYWALGHVHEFEVVSRDPLIVFPGILQGRSVRETGPHGAVLITVEQRRVTAIERLFVDEARWADLSVDISEIRRVADVPSLVTAAIEPVVTGTEGRLLAVRLQLTGTTGLRRVLAAERATLADEIQAACHRLHPDVWLEKLDLRLTEPVATAATPLDVSFDLDAALAALLNEPELRRSADAVVAEIAGKLPPGLAAREKPLGEDLNALLAEARDLLVVRANDGQ
jgi:DNA repair exonuclease SbcCD nuclease subunit